MSQKTLRVRCVLCCEILECDRNDTTPLLNHIKNAHPEVMVSDSQEKEKSELGESSKNAAPKANGDKGDKSSGKGLNLKLSDATYQLCETTKDGKVECVPVKLIKCQSGNCKHMINKDAQVLYSRKVKFKKFQGANHPGRRQLYKTSIEKWRPGMGSIHCPQCGKNVRPMIKSHADKVSSNPAGAALILTCWPFCFLPCLFPPPAKEQLYCPSCNQFLGSYDQKTQVITPNDEHQKGAEPVTKTKTSPTKAEAQPQQQSPGSSSNEPSVE